MSELRKTIKAHFIHENKGVLYRPLIAFSPSVGDELRFDDDKFYRVARLVWIFDEPEAPFTRLNIEVQDIAPHDDDLPKLASRDATELIAKLREMLTEHAQKIEELEREAYNSNLVRDQLVNALKVANEHIDWSMGGEEYRALTKIVDEALAAAKVSP